MDDYEKEEHYREVSKMYFEYCKHFSTLITAAALIEITIYQQFDISPVVAVSSIVVLSIALVFSVSGIFLLPLRASINGKFSHKDTVTTVGALMAVIAFLFVIGIFAFAIAAVGIPAWAGLGLGSILGLGIGFFTLRTTAEEP